MNNKKELIEGNIFKSLIKLAIPIMATSFLQMAYNLTDMMWLGRAGSKFVTASGTAGFFMWFGMAFIIISKIGAEVGVAQSIGRDDVNEAKNFAFNALTINMVLAIVYGIFLIINRHNLIGFFRLSDPEVVIMAEDYLFIVASGIMFAFINPIFTAIFNGYGDSKTPFFINMIGLVTNIILDPLLIFGVGPMPELGVKGAALATIFSQGIVALVFILFIKVKKVPFEKFRLFRKPEFQYIRKILRLGFLPGIQSGLFTIFAMLLARIITNWGDTPIAVQKVGSQIEAISWMTAGGFSTALSTFVGQNYGAKKWDRIFKGYFTALGIVSIIGVFATGLLIFGARPLFSIFIPDEPEAIAYGVDYLRILGVSQLFMVLEITTAGAFNGLGKTIPPSIISIIFTGLRVPLSLVLSSTYLGLNGVWWSISLSSIFKGVILAGLFTIYLVKNPNIKVKEFVKKWKVA